MKFFIYIIFIYSSLQADDSDTYLFFVENPLMVNAYFDLLNGMASIFSSNLYINILKLIFLIGGFYIFTVGIIGSIQKETSGVAKNPVSAYFNYLIYGSLILILVFSASSKPLEVRSNTINDFNCVENSNNTGFVVTLPGLLSPIFSSINFFGYYLTDVASSIYTGISFPSDIQNSFSSTAKVSLGSSLESVRDIYKFDFNSYESIKDKTIVTSNFGEIPVLYALKDGFKRFYTECILLPKASEPELHAKLLHGVTSSQNIYASLNRAFSSATNEFPIYSTPFDIRETISLNKDPGLLVMSYIDDTYINCRDYFNDVIVPAKTKVSTEDLSCNYSLKSVTKAGMYLMTKDETISNLGGLQDMVLQSAISNSLNESENRIESDLNFVSYKTISEMVLTNNAQGLYMSEMLPYLQMGIRALLYAFFPIAFMVILLPSGASILKNYLISLLWVELWGPMAAILNLFLSYYSMETLGTRFNNGDTNSLLTDAAMLSGVAGYLYAMVPGLAWLVLRGGGIMLNGMLDGLSVSYQKNFSTDSIMKDAELLKKKETYNKMNDNSLTVQQISMLEAMGKGAQTGSNMAYLQNGGGYVSHMAKSGQRDAQNTVSSNHVFNELSKMSGGDIDKMTAINTFKGVQGLHASKEFGEKYIQSHGGAVSKDGQEYLKQFGTVAQESGQIKGQSEFIDMMSKKEKLSQLGIDPSSEITEQNLSKIRSYSKGMAYNDIQKAFSSNEVRKNIGDDYYKIKSAQQIGQAIEFKTQYSKGGAMDKSLDFYKKDNPSDKRGYKDNFIGRVMHTAKLRGEYNGSTNISNSFLSSKTKEMEQKNNIFSKDIAGMNVVGTVSTLATQEGVLNSIKNDSGIYQSMGVLNPTDNNLDNLQQVMSGQSKNSVVSSHFNAAKKSTLVDLFNNNGITNSDLSNFSINSTVLDINSQSKLIETIGSPEQVGILKGENQAWNTVSTSTTIKDLQAKGFNARDLGQSRAFEEKTRLAFINAGIQPFLSVGMDKDSSIAAFAKLSGTLSAMKDIAEFILSGADLVIKGNKNVKAFKEFNKEMKEFQKENSKLISSIKELEEKKKQTKNKKLKKAISMDILKKKQELTSILTNKSFVGKNHIKLNQLGKEKIKLNSLMDQKANTIMKIGAIEAKGLPIEQKIKETAKLNNKLDGINAKIESVTNSINKNTTFLNQDIVDSHKNAKGKIQVMNIQATATGIGKSSINASINGAKSVAQGVNNNRVTLGLTAAIGGALYFASDEEEKEYIKAISKSIVGDFTTANVSSAVINSLDYTSIITENGKGVFSEHFEKYSKMVENNFNENKKTDGNFMLYTKLGGDITLATLNVVPKTAVSAWNAGQYQGEQLLHSIDTYYSKKDIREIADDYIYSAQYVANATYDVLESSAEWWLDYMFEKQ